MNRCKFSIINDKDVLAHCGLAYFYMKCGGKTEDRIMCPHWNKVVGD